MATAKDRITPKPSSPRATPVVGAVAPKIDVSVDSPKVTVDMAELTRVLDQMAAQFNAALRGIAKAMTEHDRRLIEVSAEHGRLLKAIAERSQPTPQVNVPKRPDAFEVTVDNGDDDPTVMHIRGLNSR